MHKVTNPYILTNHYNRIKVLYTLHTKILHTIIITWVFLLQANRLTVGFFSHLIALSKSQLVWYAHFRWLQRNGSAPEKAQQYLHAAQHAPSETSRDCRLCCSGIRFFCTLGISHEHNKNTWEETPLAQTQYLISEFLIKRYKIPLRLQLI